ncbi:MAG: hypothetical protein RMI04_09575 [Thermofilaceae archaeon]|nr:hypothetical protein [Thermofilaceae archaeon]
MKQRISSAYQAFNSFPVASVDRNALYTFMCNVLSILSQLHPPNFFSDLSQHVFNLSILSQLHHTLVPRASRRRYRTLTLL